MKEVVDILIAEDNEDHCILIKESFKKAKLENPLHFVSDGEELLAFLKGNTTHADPSNKKLPGLILLDLNMPKMDGREALKIIKTDKQLKKIPIIVMTTSYSEQDIESAYNSGANSYITKPINFKDFLNAILTLNDYWIQLVKLPHLYR